MKHRIHILRSKLAIPNRPDTLARHRLTRLLSPLFHKKLALVVAGAGYGKTTLIGQALHGLDADAVWYGLDESDRDVATFLGYLCAGMKRHHPAFGSTLESRLHQASLSKRSWQGVLFDFLLEFEALVQTHTIIVLDDYHLVQDSPEISEAMAFFLERMPRTLHFILVSRREPPLKISRYRAMREVIDIQEEELLFPPEEIGGLCRLIARRDIQRDEAQRLFENTGGWAAALVLCCSGKSGSAGSWQRGKPFSFRRSKRLIFQYLEENVLDRQVPDLQSFMMKTALLSHLDPAFIDRLFHMENAEEILRSLSQQHLLVFPRGDTGDGFAYHHLLRDFLRERLARDQGREGVVRLHRDMGRLMAEENNLHGALYHFLEGGHFDEIRRIVAGMAFGDFLNCPFGFLVKVFAAIPAEVVQNDASLLWVGARLSSMRGQMPAALAGFRAARDRFEATGDDTGSLNCTKDLAFHLYLTGDVAAARTQLETLRKRPHRDPFFQVEIAGYLVLFSAILGEMDAADGYYDAIHKFVSTGSTETAFPDAWMDFCYSYRLHSDGDFERADAMNRGVLESFTRMGMELLLPLANFQVSLTLFFREDPESGLAYAREGLCLADRFGISDAQLGWLLYARGLNGYGTGSLDAAGADAAAAIDIFRSLGNYWGQAAVCELRAMICRARGKNTEAAEHLRAGLSRIEGLHLRVMEGALALLSAEMMVDEGAWGEAEALMGSHGEAIGVSKFHRFRNLLLQARIHAGRQEPEKAGAAMAAGLELASSYHYSAWVRRQMRWAAPVLASCHASGFMRGTIEQLFKDADAETARDALLPLKKTGGQSLQCAADALLSALPERQPPPLFIRCLGSFEVAVGERVIPSECWRNIKAATLFKYMVLHWAQGFIPKEILMELVWPDEPEEKTRPRFHVAMTHLRRILEPALNRGVPSAYIMRQGDSYRLDIGRNGRIDFDAFSAELTAAKEAAGKGAEGALGPYLRAEAMYTGPLFAEDPYLEWAVLDRERLSSDYLATLDSIISLFEGQADWRSAIRYAETYLSLDSCAEPVYGALMRCYARLGEMARIERTFERCRAALATHLDCTPGDAACSLYETLTGKKPII
jgi:ATP/maltotriose-dependent transcriptional regulator MalT/DNA-binding SARP family transcriptional activator